MWIRRASKPSAKKATACDFRVMTSKQICTHADKNHRMIAVVVHTNEIDDPQNAWYNSEELQSVFKAKEDDAVQPFPK